MLSMGLYTALVKEISCLKDEKMAIASQRAELDRPVQEPEPVGTNIRSTCQICHRKGHKATGNRNNDGCLVGEPCRDYIFCGRKDKPKQDYVARIKKMKDREAKLTKEITGKENELKQLRDFHSRAMSVFTTTITPRLQAAFPEKYSAQSKAGRLELLRDISILRKAYNSNVNSLPTQDSPQTDRTEFLLALRKQSAEFPGVQNAPNSCEVVYGLLK
ncbi:uncharacterized protein LOC144347842, partial [Saccoglossus kowalevskii]